MLSRIVCAVGKHNWEYQFPHNWRRPSMADKRWCGECGQVELAYERWHGTYWSFDRWVREEDWYKISLGWDGVAKNRFL